MPERPAADARRFAREEDVDAIVSAFERGEMPPGGFDHAAHVAVAFVLLERHPEPEALTRVRDGLLRFLTTQLGDRVAAEVRYRETITAFWIRLIAAARSGQDPTRPRAERLRELQARFADPGVIHDYYSQGRLDDPAARRAFLEPDLRPLPARWGSP